MLFLFFNLVNTESDHAVLDVSMLKEKKKAWTHKINLIYWHFG